MFRDASQTSASLTMFSGGAEGIRTLDLLNAIPIRSILGGPYSTGSSLKRPFTTPFTGFSSPASDGLKLLEPIPVAAP
jgi:hypothetical protein